MTIQFASTLLLGALALGACGSDGDGGLDDAKPFLQNYAKIAEASYGDSQTKAEALATAISAFVAAPTAVTLEAARTAWIAARVPYRQTEGMRFYGGPIDDPDDEREGLINAWPLDEATIDYVQGMATAGAINDTAGFPTISVAAISQANGKNGETDVKTGYHAIEFLLWGQDFSTSGPGARPFTDYLTTGGTAANQARRAQYLGAVTTMLVDDLKLVHEGWKEGAGTYRAEFLAAAPEEGLRRVLTGIGTLAASELSGERMLTAYENKDQEDEHSCFSDTTAADLLGNATSIANIWFGKYGTIDGPGLDDLVARRDATLATATTAKMNAMLAAVTAIPAPFDQAILGEDTAAGRVKVLAAVRAVQDVGESIVEVSTELGIAINTDI